MLGVIICFKEVFISGQTSVVVRHVGKAGWRLEGIFEWKLQSTTPYDPHVAFPEASFQLHGGLPPPPTLQAALTPLIFAEARPEVC